MSIDDRVRTHPVCPLCYGVKAVGLVACWTCYRGQGLRNGNLKAEATIQAFGERLAEVNPARMTPAKAERREIEGEMR